VVREILLLSILLLLQFLLQLFLQELKYTGHAAVRGHLVLRVTCAFQKKKKRKRLENDKHFLANKNSIKGMGTQSPADTRSISLAGLPTGVSNGRPDDTQLRPI
jgi:hypothetical protein